MANSGRFSRTAHLSNLERYVGIDHPADRERHDCQNRGLGECKASEWISDPVRLGKLMSAIECRAGHTQIGRILTHANKETKLLKVSALVFVGDAFEEKADTVVPVAHELGRLGVHVFM